MRRAALSSPLAMPLALLAALGAGPAGAAQPKGCRPTLADYRALKTGDSLNTVIARLGCRGRRVTAMTYGRQRRADYSWRGRGSFGANLILTFANGRLTGKSELGLH